MIKKMKTDIDFFLGLIGISLSVLGFIGTYYQILGCNVFWIILIISGSILILFYIWKTTSKIREIVATFGERWRLIDGRLKIGNTINVALRAKTMQELLNQFQKEYPNDNQTLIKDAGKKIGESFANDLKAELLQYGIETIIKSGKKNDLLEKKLSLWTKYDSSTGMGIFELGQLEFTDGLRGNILLKNSFLAYDRISEIPTCTFMEGYIEGVISKILQMPITVKEIECSSVTGSEYCKFEITT